MMNRPPRITILYHFFHPDNVVSAQLFSDLAVDLAAKGWQVEAVTSNRSCHAQTTYRPTREHWNGVNIQRIWRPQWKQSSAKGRILNALWMIVAWCRIAFRSKKNVPDVLFIGTDPVLSILVARVVRLFRPCVKIVHWAYDLYPEAALADGLMRDDSRFIRLIKSLLRSSYRSCDLVADLGQCMRQRLEAYGLTCRKFTVPPWALAEPKTVEQADPALRAKLFGNAKLTLLYSGNFGRAHEFTEFLALARQLRNTDIVMGFSVRGNRVDELRDAVTADDTNIRFLPFAEESELSRHLATGDIHLVSLRQNWTGIVVPSKFFGCLASGRPVIFAGEEQSCISQWIGEYQLGWHLSETNITEIAEALKTISQSPGQLQTKQQHCWEIYQKQFSRKHLSEEMHQELTRLLSPS
ncbi:MAG: glycosyltransferase family 4 protein [Planctomycetia bacterium]|nr:glycosyltransferase family 4 protein [Planctomycetia bacterium]